MVSTPLEGEGQGEEEKRVGQAGKDCRVAEI